MTLRVTATVSLTILTRMNKLSKTLTHAHCPCLLCTNAYILVREVEREREGLTDINTDRQRGSYARNY